MSMLMYEQEAAVTKTRRLQVLIEQSQWDRLEAAASQRGVSVGSLVREAIDIAVPGGADGRSAAARTILAADPMAVPDADDLRGELDELRGRRG
jgi:hypothetical protein